jgi:hypothetical protein
VARRPRSRTDRDAPLSVVETITTGFRIVATGERLPL